MGRTASCSTPQCHSTGCTRSDTCCSHTSTDPQPIWCMGRSARACIWFHTARPRIEHTCEGSWTMSLGCHRCTWPGAPGSLASVNTARPPACSLTAPRHIFHPQPSTTWSCTGDRRCRGFDCTWSLVRTRADTCCMARTRTSRLGRRCNHPPRPGCTWYPTGSLAATRSRSRADRTISLYLFICIYIYIHL